MDGTSIGVDAGPCSLSVSYPLELAMTRTVAALVGVSNPDPFEFRGQRFNFGTAQGVRGDLDWYAALLSNQIPADELSLTILDEKSEVSVSSLRRRLTSLTQTLKPTDTFILVLVGHGFQALDDNHDESDGKDEIFAAGDGPIADDFFAALWAPLDETCSVIVFADTCSSDSVGIAGGGPVSEHVFVPVRGPSRLSLAASSAAEDAGTVRVLDKERGVMSKALQDAWEHIPAARTSYLAWFREAAQLVAVRRPVQHPQLRYLGQDLGLLIQQPFT